MTMLSLTEIVPIIMVLLTPNCLVGATSNEGITIFNKSGLVPHYITMPPTELADVHYGNIKVVPGIIITAAESQLVPGVEWKTENEVLYTLIMMDPDIPPTVPAKEVVHWLVVNIPGSDISKGELLIEYIGPSPPIGSPAHRYPILIYKQPLKIEPERYSKMTDEKKGKLTLRMKLLLKDIIEQLKLGTLVAANYHITAPDEDAQKLFEIVSEKYA